MIKKYIYPTEWYPILELTDDIYTMYSGEFTKEEIYQIEEAFKKFQSMQKLIAVRCNLPERYHPGW